MSRQNRRAVVAYTLRRIDPELWKKVKARANYEGHTVRYVLVELMKWYVAKGLPPSAPYEESRE